MAHKYRAKPIVIDNVRFASQREGNRYRELMLLFRAGAIRNLEIQPEFEFELKGKPIFRYIADFAYFEGERRVVEDVKGVKTPVYRLKKKLIEAQFNIQIMET